MVVGHPAQEGRGPADLVGVDAGGRAALHLGGEHEALAAHLRPVLDGLADVLEDVAHRRLEVAAAALVALAVDGQEHPRLGELADGGLGAPAGDVAGDDLLEVADGVAADDELRVDDEVDVDAGADEGPGDGVDEEGHVVGDDLDDRAGVGPAVGLGRRVVDADVGDTGEPVAGQLEVAAGGPGVDLGRPRRQLVERHVAVVPPDEVVAPTVRRGLLERCCDRGEDVLAAAGLGLRHGAVALLRRDSPGAVEHLVVLGSEPSHPGAGRAGRAAPGRLAGETAWCPPDRYSAMTSRVRTVGSAA